MDNKLSIINKLLDKKKEKYPNITSVWKNYINIKKIVLKKIWKMVLTFLIILKIYNMKI